MSELVTPRRILVDQDNVVADFELGFKNAWDLNYPDRPSIPLELRTTFYVKDQYPEEYTQDIIAIYTSKGFIRTLPPIEGAIQALIEMREAGHIIRICTSPLSIYQNCVEEKHAWIEEYLGSDWVRNLILAKDKTEIRGDYLIDDKPEITGDLKPTWEHILFDRPNNHHVNEKRRLTHWSRWRDFIGN